MPWVKVVKWYNEDNRLRLNMLCNDAHGILVPKGSYFLEEVSVMENISLVFENPKYKPIWIDILEYKSRSDERYNPIKQEETDPVKDWYLTQGRTIDCVYYLQPTDTREAKLMKEVCGLRPW